MNWTKEITHISPTSEDPVTGDRRKILIMYPLDRGKLGFNESSATSKVRILRQHFAKGKDCPDWTAREAPFLHNVDPRMYLTESEHAWLEFKPGAVLAAQTDYGLGQ